MSDDPTKEACQLSALRMHAEAYEQTSNIDPFVLVKINGEWLSVRAGFDATGEHRNAVALEYLPSECHAYYAVETACDGKWTEVAHDDDLEALRLSLADSSRFPMDAPLRIVHKQVIL